MHTQQPLETPIRIQYGHDGKRVLMGFSQPIQGHAMTPEQCRDVINSLSECLKALAAHQGGGNGG